MSALTLMPPATELDVHVDQHSDLARALLGQGVALKALLLTSTGQPGHPLYVRADAQLIDYTPETTA